MQCMHLIWLWGQSMAGELLQQFHIHTWCSTHSRAGQQACLRISTLHSLIWDKFKFLFFFVNLWWNKQSDDFAIGGESNVAIEKIWRPTQFYKASDALISRSAHANMLSNCCSKCFLPYGVVINYKQYDPVFFKLVLTISTTKISNSAGETQF